MFNVGFIVANRATQHFGNDLSAAAACLANGFEVVSPAALQATGRIHVVGTTTGAGFMVVRIIAHCAAVVTYGVKNSSVGFNAFGQVVRHDISSFYSHR